MNLTGKTLHPVQSKLLEILKQSQDDPKTFMDLKEMLDVSSTSVVAHHMTQLEKKGYLKRNPSNTKDYHIIEDGPEKPISYINLYGLAGCGPQGNILDDSPIDRIPIASRLLSFPSDEAFMVKAKGDSMEPVIHDGDYVIARKSQTVDGSRCAICVNDGEAMIKKIYYENNKTILVSINQNHQPFTASDDFRIVGEVKNIIARSI